MGRRRIPQVTFVVIATVLLASCGGGGGMGTATSLSTQRELSPISPPPPTPGSKRAAPGVPTSPQGDNSIQTWGREASVSQRQAAAAAVRTYLEARAARRWARACSLLAVRPRREQRRFAGGASCAKAMASFAAGAEDSALREEAEMEVLSFRVAADYAFLIYRRPGPAIYATALTREGGRWKLITVTPDPIS